MPLCKPEPGGKELSHTALLVTFHVIHNRKQENVIHKRKQENSLGALRDWLCGFVVSDNLPFMLHSYGQINVYMYLLQEV